MISRVKKSIKPFLVFGAGNVPIIVDENAKLNMQLNQLSYQSLSIIQQAAR